MNTKSKNAPRRGLNFDAFTTAFLPKPIVGDWAVERSELDHEIDAREKPAPRRKPRKRPMPEPVRNPTTVTAKHNCKPEDSELILQVQIEHYDGTSLSLFTLFLAPGDRTSDVMRRLAPHVPNLRQLELWTYPRQIGALCKDAPVYDLVMLQKQRLQLRRKPGFFKRRRQQHHDLGCECL